MAEVVMDLLSTPLLKQGHLEPVAQDEPMSKISTVGNNQEGNKKANCLMHFPCPRPMKYKI